MWGGKRFRSVDPKIYPTTEEAMDVRRKSMENFSRSRRLPMVKDAPPHNQ